MKHLSLFLNKNFILLFIISRLFFYFLGVRFDSSYIDVDWHALDTQLMHDRLWESLWYHHSHAPLFNLLVATVYRAAGQYDAAVFQGLFIVIGLAHLWVLRQTARLLHLSVWGQNLAMLMYCFSPSVIFFENWLFYDYIVSFLITLSGYFLLRYWQKSGVPVLVFFFSTIALLVLMRSFFSYHFFVFVIFFIFYLRKIPAIATLRALAIPGLVVAGWLLKNAVLFGSLGTSTWLGMNISRIALRNAPLETAFAEGKIPAVCQYPAFSSIERYAPLLRQPDLRYPAVRVLHDLRRSNDSINYHHIDYIQVSDSFAKASRWAILHFPQNYLRNVGYAFAIYFTPAHSYQPRFAAPPAIDRYCNWVNLNAFSLSAPETTSVRKYPMAMAVNFIWSLAMLIIPIFWLVKSWNFWQKSAVSSWVFYSIFCILYVMLIGNFLEFGENMRFRFQTVPLSAVLSVLVLHAIVAGKSFARGNEQMPEASAPL